VFGIKRKKKLSPERQARIDKRAQRKKEAIAAKVDVVAKQEQRMDDKLERLRKKTWKGQRIADQKELGRLIRHSNRLERHHLKRERAQEKKAA